MIRYPQRITRSEQTKLRAQSSWPGPSRVYRMCWFVGVVLSTVRTEICFHPNPLPSVTPLSCRLCQGGGGRWAAHTNTSPSSPPIQAAFGGLWPPSFHLV